MLVLSCCWLCGCFHLGPERLDQDQLGYSRALGNAEKRQTLLNMVRLRYADTPTFLDATQVISGYQLQRGATGGFELFPHADPSSYLTGSGSVQLQESPTFTFQPVTGDQFAQSFLRPLAPADLLPLAMGGLPVDVLLRLSVQSVNALQNASALTNAGASGSPAFFLLLYDLRLLQIAGLVGIQFERSAKSAVQKHEPSEKHDGGPGRIYLAIGRTRDPRLVPVVAEVKHTLGLSPAAREAEVIYGRAPTASGQVAILTRSMLGVLGQLAFQIEVPPEDIASGRTMATVGEIGVERRPTMRVRSGAAAPADAFTAVEYHRRWFWVADDDFDSKLAFTMLQILLSLAKTSSAPGTVITIPAG